MSMELPTPVLYVLLSAIVNAAVTWGAVSVKLAWMRRDIDTNTRDLELMDDRVRQLERGHP